MQDISADTLAADTLSARVCAFANGLDWLGLPPDVQHAARRHFVDTFGVITAGLQRDVATRVARTLMVNADGLPVPGLDLRLSPQDFAFLCGTAAHGIELDDGYRQGSVHAGVSVVPALLAASRMVPTSGSRFLSALVVGYEVISAVAEASHPALRDRGFHPTSVVGPLGAAMACGHLLGLSARQLSDALAIAASSSGGLFAFLDGGGDVKRVHAGQAARAGLMAALFAREGINGPEDILSRPSGFAQAFPYGFDRDRLQFALPPACDFRILDGYFKPYACCRHLQPAIEALLGLLKTHDLGPDDVEHVDVETYAIAQFHAHTGWDEFAAAQLSFPFTLAVALKFRSLELEHFDEDIRTATWLNPLTAKFSIRSSAEMDALYPAKRPARVTVTANGHVYSAFAEEALGCRQLPLDDAALAAKFERLVAPVLGVDGAGALCKRLWLLDQQTDLNTFPIR